MADNINMHFTSREKLEVFIRQNPKRFLEELERSPDLRNNFQQLLQDWNNGDLIKIAQLLQGIEVRNPINNKLMIVEEKAKSFYHWSFNELREVQQNPYHKLSSFQHYLHETMKKREELDEEEEKERLRKEKEHKVQSKFDKDRLEQEKVNMHIVMKTIEAQFKQSLQHLVANMNVKALQKLADDLKPYFDNVKDNPEYNQFNLNWEKACADVIKGMPNADKLDVLVKSVGLQLFAKTKDEKSHMQQIALFESLGVKNAKELLDKVRDGKITVKELGILVQNIVAHNEKQSVQHEYGNIPGMVRGDQGAIQDVQNRVHEKTQLISKAIPHRNNVEVQLDMINNIRDTVMGVKDTNIATDVNNNLHVDGETFKLKGNKI